MVGGWLCQLQSLDFVRWLRTGCREQAQKKQEENSFFIGLVSIYFVNSVQSYIKGLPLVFICYFCGEVLNINYENHKADYL